MKFNIIYMCVRAHAHVMYLYLYLLVFVKNHPYHPSQASNGGSFHPAKPVIAGGSILSSPVFNCFDFIFDRCLAAALPAQSPSFREALINFLGPFRRLKITRLGKARYFRLFNFGIGKEKGKTDLFPLAWGSLVQNFDAYSFSIVFIAAEISGGTIARAAFDMVRPGVLPVRAGFKKGVRGFNLSLLNRKRGLI